MEQLHHFNKWIKAIWEPTGNVISNEVDQIHSAKLGSRDGFYIIYIVFIREKKLSAIQGLEKNMEIYRVPQSG